MAVRGAMLMLAMPPLLIAGYFAARRQRARLRLKAVEDQRREVLSFIQSELNRALERERRVLWSWVTSLHEDWKRVLKEYDRREIGRLMREAKTQASQQGRQASQKLRQLQREQRALQSLGARLQDTLLVELKRRQRELGGAGE